MRTLEQALGAMRDIPRWFLYRLTLDEAAGKYRKVPCNLQGSPFPIDASQSSNWSTFVAAKSALARLPRTVEQQFTLGFWLGADLGYFFLDIDLCVANQKPTELANELLALFPGALTEWSSSGKGIHIIGRATLPNHRSRDGSGLNLELYHSDRGIAFGLTGVANGCADTSHDVAAAHLVSKYFSPSNPAPPVAQESPELRLSDDELIQRMLKSRRSAKSAFTGAPSLRELWEGNCVKNSEHDMALASHLAFWCQRNETQIERLMWRSGMVREKWHKHRTYLKLTISSACAGCANVYQNPKAVLPERAPSQQPRVQSAAALLQKSFAPVQWAVTGLLPEGVTILAGDPKIGKSWLVYQMCVAVAAGAALWDGRDPEVQGDALYLDLEGNDRRLQRRLSQLLSKFPPGTDTARLHFATDWSRSEAGVEEIASWLREHPQCRIVVIDTISSFRDNDPGRKSAYAHDYSVGEMLKPLAREFSCAIVLVMHNRKQAAGDVLHKVSGTQGMTGGVDNVLVLQRTRGGIDAALTVDGRDIEEPGELALQFDDGFWRSVGSLSDAKRSSERNAIIRTLASMQHGATAKQIHAALPEKSYGSIRTLLTKMVRSGEVHSEAGVYVAAAQRISSTADSP